MSTVVSTTMNVPLEFDGATLTLRDQTVVAIGEYAELGEPDVLVLVLHALDGEGNDVRERIAHAIAPILTDGATMPG